MTAGDLSQVLLAAAAVISSLATLAVALHVGQKVDRVERATNGQTQAFNELSTVAGYQQGVLDAKLGQIGTIVPKEAQHGDSE
jgi:hypothetical protein